MKRVAMRASVTGAAVGAAWLLAGCAGADAPGEPPVPKVTAGGVVLPDACAVLSAADVQDATGLDLAEGVEIAQEPGRKQSQCIWQAASSEEFPQVLVHVADPVFTFADQRAAAEGLYPTVDDVSVPGASDAFVTTKGQHLGMDVGPYWVMVTLIEDSDRDLTAEVTELATRVAGRISAS
jgi:hypothetical protein